MVTKLKSLPTRLADYKVQIIKDLNASKQAHEIYGAPKGNYIRRKRELELELKALDAVTENIYKRLNK